MPDINKLINVLLGKDTSDEVLLMEMIIDNEIIKEYIVKYLSRPWVDYSKTDKEKRCKYWDNIILFYQSLGYSCFRVSNALTFEFDTKKANDKSITSTKDRGWANHSGKIITEEDFKAYPWPTVEDIDLFDYEYVSSKLPQGMGILACVYGGIFEMLCEYLVGFEQLCFMEYENEQLLEKIFKKTGDILLEAYEKIVKISKVAVLFQGDDFGFTQGLMFPPLFYEKYVFPWHKNLANIAHANNKPYFLHSCGNLRDIKTSLLEIGIDAKHSFEDKGWSVIDFSNEMKGKMGVIGGVDVDKLCRYDKKQLEEYCIKILDVCHNNGRYAFGSGNSIANYVPLENFLIMINTAKNYKKG